jgi:hypothetical protein
MGVTAQRHVSEEQQVFVGNHKKMLGFLGVVEFTRNFEAIFVNSGSCGFKT